MNVASQALSQRIHYGKFVAEAKFRCDEPLLWCCAHFHCNSASCSTCRMLRIGTMHALAATLLHGVMPHACEHIIASCDGRTWDQYGAQIPAPKHGM